MATSATKSADEFAKVSYEQMVGPYDSEYPGLARASIILFEGGAVEFDRDALRRRFDNMIGSNAEIVARLTKSGQHLRPVSRVAVLGQFSTFVDRRSNDG